MTRSSLHTMSKVECMVGSTQVNPRTPDDAGYHDTPTLDNDVDKVYQEEEFPPSFVVDSGARLDDLVGDVDDIEMSIAVKQK
jgi:hypothetical protein